MKIFKSKIGKIAASLFLIITITTSCDITEMDINNDPNNPLAVTPDLLLPTVMLNASSIFAGGLNSNTHGFVGAIASADTYNLSTTSYVNTWQFLYTGPLKDLDEVIKFCEARGNLPGYLGIAQTLKAYYFSLMVDLWGDIPYFTAFNANNTAAAERNPVYDSGAEIYADCISLLSKAVTNLSATDPTNLATSDPIYAGSRASWIRAANSIRLKLLVQTRAVQNNAAAITDLLTNASLITATADDFQFRFGRLLQPDNRHPWYQAAYTGAENGYNYLSHQMMFEMIRDGDPRLPFYFKRQTTNILDFNDATQRSTAPCTQTVGCVYAYLVLNTGSRNVHAELQAAGRISNPLTTADRAYLAGFFGRDRGDNAGVPADGSLRTAPGVYPAGGFYDDGGFTAGGNATRAVRGNNAFGDGVFPMLTASMVRFYRIEAILNGLATGNARTLFEEAIRLHIDKVVAFGRALDSSAVSPSSAAIEAYVNLWLARWDAATTNNGRLDVMFKQAWFSNFGNGYELYNGFRRTGFPTDVMAPIFTVRGFPLRLPYSLDDMTLNQSVTSEIRNLAFDQAPVFWDR